MIGPGPGVEQIREQDAPSPVVVRESRYSGAYSGGHWVIVAGAWSPMSETDAFASDVPCMDFWAEREENGPEFTIEVNGTEFEAYAASGSDPNELVREMYEYYEGPE